jgi:hypothetical protein
MAIPVIANAVHALRWKIAHNMTEPFESVSDHFEEADRAIDRMSNSELLNALVEADEALSIKDFA